MKSSGRRLLAVFRSGPESPWATAAVAAIRHLVPLLPALGPEDPGQFSWSDPARVRRILDGAGFHDVALTPLDVSFHLGADAAEAAEFATFVGQGARLLQGQPEEALKAARAALVDFFKDQEGRTVSVCQGHCGWFQHKLAPRDTDIEKHRNAYRRDRRHPRKLAGARSRARRHRAS